MEIRVVGVDAAFRNFGIVAATVNSETLAINVMAMELFKTDGQAGKTVRKNSDDIRRARIILKGFHEYANVAAVAIAEVPTGTQSARASWTLGITVGILAACPVPLIEVTPSEVKLASVGNKTASKSEMIKWAHDKHPEASWLKRKLKGEYVLLNENEHLADALASIYAGVQSQQFQAAAEMMRHFSGKVSHG